MRRTIAQAFILLLLFYRATAAVGQERDLQLTTSLNGQRLCALNANLAALLLSLRLRYTNVGREKLILYKGDRLFYQVFISRGGEAEASSSGRSELRATHARYFDERPEKIVAPAPPGSAFTILSPGSSYETTQLVSIPVARRGEPVFNVSIAAGEHVLNLASSTWYESRKLAEDLRDRWRRYGRLWTDPLISNGIAFKVVEDRAPFPCR